MPSKRKFNEDDRRKVIAVVERHYRISLTVIGSYRKYLRDEHGRRFIVLGGYGDWHGIRRNVFEHEEASPADTTLIIAKRSTVAIEIFSGPLRPLLDHKNDLPKTADEYVFNIRTFTNGLSVREVPSLMLRRLDETKCSLEEKQAEIKYEEVAAAVQRLSPAERAQLIRRLKDPAANQCHA